jgi:hypothetical protein
MRYASVARRLATGRSPSGPLGSRSDARHWRPAGAHLWARLGHMRRHDRHVGGRRCDDRRLRVWLPRRRPRSECSRFAVGRTLFPGEEPSEGHAAPARPRVRRYASRGGDGRSSLDADEPGPSRRSRSRRCPRTRRTFHHQSERPAPAPAPGPAPVRRPARGQGGGTAKRAAQSCLQMHDCPLKRHRVFPAESLLCRLAARTE